MVRREMYRPNPGEQNQIGQGQEKPKKMSEMDAHELEQAILENLDNRYFFGDAKVFNKAVEVLGSDHALVRAVLRIKNSDPKREEKISQIVEKYRQSKDALSAVTKEDPNKTEETEFKKAA